jgi:hypothetical protein
MDTAKNIIIKLVNSKKQATKKQEDLIAKSAKHSYIYSRHVLNSRFIKGEKIISSDGRLSYFYASYWGFRFKEAEKQILISAYRDYYLDNLKKVKNTKNNSMSKPGDLPTTNRE